MDKNSFTDTMLKLVSENENQEVFKEFRERMTESLNHYDIKLLSNNDNEFNNNFKISTDLINSYKNGYINAKLINSKLIIIYIVLFFYITLFFKT